MRSSLKDILIGAALAASLIVPGLARGDAPASPHDGIVGQGPDLIFIPGRHFETFDQPAQVDAALDAFLAH